MSGRGRPNKEAIRDQAIREAAYRRAHPERLPSLPKLPNRMATKGPNGEWEIVHGATRAGFTCSSTERRTPDAVVQAVRDLFGGTIVLDAASDDDNPTNALWCWTKQDGQAAFENPWPDRTFLNPPYGASIERWVHKAAYEASACAPRLTVLTALKRLEAPVFRRCTLDCATVSCWLIFNGRLKFEPMGDDVGKPANHPLPGSHVMWFHNCRPSLVAIAFEGLGTVCQRAT